MSDQQLQKLNQTMQINQQLQQRLGGGQNPFLGSLQARYGAALSNQGGFPNAGGPLPTPAPFNFNVQPQATPLNPFQQVLQQQMLRRQQPGPAGPTWISTR
jgi:hypothetical protein